MNSKLCSKLKINLFFDLLIILVIYLNPIAYSLPKEIKNSNTHNFSVTVVDSAHNTPLELVTLILKQNGKIVNVKETNQFGVAHFIDIAAGNYFIFTQYIGYKDISIPVRIDQLHNNIKILLQESAIGLKEIVVTGKKENHVSNYIDVKAGYKSFELETFHPAPEARMTTVIQENLTGAVRAPSGEVHIRGQHGEFTYLIDGIPIPLGVFGGLNEVVDPGVIKNITFYTGGFPAEYGGQIAAIVDIRNQVPPGNFHLNLSSYAGSYLTSNNENLGSNVGTFKSLNSNGQSLSVSNHIDNFGYFITGSRAETDRRIDQPVPKLFNDHGFDYFLYGKMDYFLSENDYLTTNLNYSLTQTQIPFDPIEGINYDTQGSYNSFQTLSYYHTFSNETDKSNELFAGLYVREGGLKYDTSPYDQTVQYLLNDSTKSYTVNQDRSFVTYGTRIKFSNELSHHFGYAAGLEFSVTDGKENFKFNDVNGNGPLNSTRFTGSDFALFVQSNIHPYEWTRIDAGLRYDQHIAPVIQLQSQLEPRLKISFFTDDFTTLYASYDRLFIPINIEGLSSIATSVGDSAAPTFPEKDNLFEGGIIHNFLNGFTSKFDFFYKESTPGLDDQTLGASTIRVNVNINRIIVRGLELSLTYTDPSSPFSGYLNSAIIHAFGIGPISGGFIPANLSAMSFDLDHDQRLSIVAGLNYQPRNWFLNLVGIYGSGLTNGNGNYSFKTGLFDFNQSAHTTPSWIFNLSGGYTFGLENGTSIEPSLTITNLLDHAHLLKGAFFSSASFEERRNVVFKISYHL